LQARNGVISKGSQKLITLLIPRLWSLILKVYGICNIKTQGN